MPEETDHIIPIEQTPIEREYPQDAGGIGRVGDIVPNIPRGVLDTLPEWLQITDGDEGLLYWKVEDPDDREQWKKKIPEDDTEQKGIRDAQEWGKRVDEIERRADRELDEALDGPQRDADRQRWRSRKPELDLNILEDLFREGIRPGIRVRIKYDTYVRRLFWCRVTDIDSERKTCTVEFDERPTPLTGVSYGVRSPVIGGEYALHWPVRLKPDPHGRTEPRLFGRPFIKVPPRGKKTWLYFTDADFTIWRRAAWPPTLDEQTQQLLWEELSDTVVRYDEWGLFEGAYCSLGGLVIGGNKEFFVGDGLQLTQARQGPPGVWTVDALTGTPIVPSTRTYAGFPDFGMDNENPPRQLSIRDMFSLATSNNGGVINAWQEHWGWHQHTLKAVQLINGVLQVGDYQTFRDTRPEYYILGMSLDGGASFRGLWQSRPPKVVFGNRREVHGNQEFILSPAVVAYQELFQPSYTSASAFEWTIDGVKHSIAFIIGYEPSFEYPDMVDLLNPLMKWTGPEANVNWKLIILDNNDAKVVPLDMPDQVVQAYRWTAQAEGTLVSLLFLRSPPPIEALFFTAMPDAQTLVIYAGSTSQRSNTMYKRLYRYSSAGGITPLTDWKPLENCLLLSCVSHDGNALIGYNGALTHYYISADGGETYKLIPRDMTGTQPLEFGRTFIVEET